MDSNFTASTTEATKVANPTLLNAFAHLQMKAEHFAPQRYFSPIRRGRAFRCNTLRFLLFAGDGGWIDTLHKRFVSMWPRSERATQFDASCGGQQLINGLSTLAKGGGRGDGGNRSLVSWSEEGDSGWSGGAATCSKCTELSGYQ